MRLYPVFLCLTFLFSNTFLMSAQDALNVELFGLVNRGDERYSGCWSYVSPDGSEYALIGAKTGTAIYPIDDPDNIVELDFVPGPETNWREITVLGEHAYVVTDVTGTNHSMQVIDLSYLPDSVSLITSYTATFTKGHIIQKDIFSDAPYVYVMGTCGNCGVQILDVSNPANPVEIGVYDPGYYIHDAHIRGDLLFAAAFNEYEMDIVDISDKTNPLLIGKIAYDGKNTHSSSLSEDGRILYIADEADEFPMRVINVEDVTDPREIGRYTANSASLVHNPYVRGDFLYISHNTEGFRVLDIADPELPVEVGYYDTYAGTSGGGNGLWSACPYFPSGKIIGGDRQEGLFIWTFTETRAARIYGVVKDSLSGEIIDTATLVVDELSDTLLYRFLEERFIFGAMEGSYTLNASAGGYAPKSLALELEPGDSIWFEINLVPKGYSQVSEFLFQVPEMNVFPNPANASFSIDLSSTKNVSRLEIQDMDGRLIYSQKVGNQSITEMKTKLKNGSYLIKALDEYGELMGRGKVLVQ